MINLPHYQPCLVTPTNVNGIKGVLLEDGKISVQARLLEHTHSYYHFACLAIVDCEMLNNQVVITDLNIIAANVDTYKMRKWLAMLDDNLKGYFVEILALINQIGDQYLQIRVFSAIFDELFKSSKLRKHKSPVELESFYQLILATGEFVWQQCCDCRLSHREVGAILARSILEEIENYKCANKIK